jgi:hypothetical protein
LTGHLIAKGERGGARECCMQLDEGSQVPGLMIFTRTSSNSARPPSDTLRPTEPLVAVNGNAPSPSK